MGEDDLSFKNIKQAQSELEPLLLKLVNSVIKTTSYPESLNTTKIIPIRKPTKDKTSYEAWRPINVVAALSNIIEHMLLKQILTHLKDNKLVPPQHHGSIKGKSTQTLITELHDLMLDDHHQHHEGALIVLDQSKAYDCINHEILIGKMAILGFLPQATAIMASFLNNRKQFVQVQAHRSQKINLGPNSVIQGSTLSCTLFLIYIMDMPLIFHTQPHTPQEYRECKQTNLKMYVDDSYLKTYKQPNTTMEETVMQTMAQVIKYTKANELAINPEKTLVMLQTRDQRIKDNFSVELNGREIKHQSQIKILGNLLTDNLTWDLHVSKIVIPALKNRLRTLRLTNKYLGPGFRAIYTNSVFGSKLMFGLETWWGAQKSKIKQVQALQDQSTKLALPPSYYKLSSNQRHRVLKWLPIEKETTRATLTLTHTILHTGTPQEIASQMPINTKSLRVLEHHKLDTKPRWLGANKVNKASYSVAAMGRDFSLYITLHGSSRKFQTLRPHIHTFERRTVRAHP